MSNKKLDYPIGYYEVNRVVVSVDFAHKIISDNKFIIENTPAEIIPQITPLVFILPKLGQKL